jgi:hypothetical protein
MHVQIWLQVLSALLTPAIAIAVGTIGWLQWWTNERKRKQDLFDKRWDYFKRARSVFDQGPRAPDGYHFHSEDLDELAMEGAFLFGPDIEALIWSFPDHFDRSRRDRAWYETPFKKYMQLN